jgi:hypothetical protein
VWGLLGCGWLWAALVLAAPADVVIPIGSITINPMANNRRAVILQGKTKTVNAYHGQDSFGRSLCGQGFILEDETGSLGRETPEGARGKRFLTPFVCLCRMINVSKYLKRRCGGRGARSLRCRISPSGRTSFAVVERSMSDRLLARTYRLC